LLGVVRVSGWSGPNTRIWSGSSAWDSANAPPGVARLARPGGDVVGGREGVGVVGAQAVDEGAGPSRPSRQIDAGDDVDPLVDAATTSCA
jgi:hypothetical protein